MQSPKSASLKFKRFLISRFRSPYGEFLWGSLYRHPIVAIYFFSPIANGVPRLVSHFQVSLLPKPSGLSVMLVQGVSFKESGSNDSNQTGIEPFIGYYRSPGELRGAARLLLSQSPWESDAVTYSFVPCTLANRSAASLSRGEFTIRSVSSGCS